MSKPYQPMHQDPDEPAAVRELLGTAARTSSNYNVEHGIARHVANVESGMAAPEWAADFVGKQAAVSGGTSIAAGTVVAWAVGSLATAAIVVGAVLQSVGDASGDSADPQLEVASANVHAMQGDAEGSAAVQAANERSRQLGLAVKRRRQQAGKPLKAARRAAGVPSHPSAESRRRAQSVGRLGGSSSTARPSVAGIAPGGRRARQATVDGVGGAQDGRAAQSRAVRAARTTRAGGDRFSAGQGAKNSARRTAVSKASARGRPGAASTGPAGSRPARSRPAARVVATTQEVATAPEVKADQLPEPERAVRKQRSAEQVDSEVAEARLEREMRMLKVAQANLISNPERALKLAEQGEREFAGSMFTQERHAVLILALVQLGRIDDARRAAAGYLQRHPRGPFSDRVRRALAEGRVSR